MLSKPNYTQVVGDPRTFVREVHSVSIYNNVDVTVIDRIGAHYRDPTVYSMGTAVANGDDLFVCYDLSRHMDGRIIKAPISFENAKLAPLEHTLLNGKDDIVMPPVNGRRDHYYQRGIRALGISAIYAFIYQHVLDWNYINIKTRTPDVLHWFIGGEELVPAFDEYMFESLAQLTASIEEITQRNPELVLELKSFDYTITILVYCDYRTWLYMDKEYEYINKH